MLGDLNPAPASPAPQSARPNSPAAEQATCPALDACALPSAAPGETSFRTGALLRSCPLLYRALSSVSHPERVRPVVRLQSWEQCRPCGAAAVSRAPAVAGLGRGAGGPGRMWAPRRPGPLPEDDGSGGGRAGGEGRREGRAAGSRGWGLGRRRGLGRVGTRACGRRLLARLQQSGFR